MRMKKNCNRSAVESEGKRGVRSSEDRTEGAPILSVSRAILGIRATASASREGEKEELTELLLGVDADTKNQLKNSKKRRYLTGDKFNVPQLQGPQEGITQDTLLQKQKEKEGCCLYHSHSEGYESETFWGTKTRGGGVSRL